MTRHLEAILILLLSPLILGAPNQVFKSVPSNIRYGKADNVCTSTECTLSAAGIIEAMDMTADPCQDFFQFACGGWLDNNPIPSDASRWSQFNALSVELSNALSTILEETINTNDSVPINQAKWMYSACMNESNLESEGTKPLSEILEPYGGWPMTQSAWDSSNFDWQIVVADGRKDWAFGYLIYAWVFADEKNTFETALYIDQTSLGMPRSVIIEPENYVQRFEAYKKYIKTTAQLIATSLGEAVEETELDQQIEDLVGFEMSLAILTTPDEDRRDIERMYNPMLVSELGNITPAKNIDWINLLSSMFSGVDVTIDANTRVIVQEITYIEQLSQLLTVTDNKVLSNYLSWRYVRNLGDETTAAMRQASFEYDMVALGLDEPKPRSEQCADETNNYMGMAVGVPYVEKYFSEQAKNESNYLVEDLRAAFKDLLEANEWMDEETKPLAMEKADAISKFIGYPDWYDESNGLEDFYVDLVAVNEHTDHLENIAAARNWSSSKELNAFGSPTNRDLWLSPPTIVNAFYLPEFNSITFPAGILQPSFYRANTLQAINYGGIGQGMGHEITHGFDDQGCQNDKDGNAIPWWSNATLEAFNEKAQCIIDQYNAYTMPEIDYLLPNATVNGITTQGENIADNGGLREAYLAYQKYVEDNGPEPRLPGLEQYSSNQIFFLSNANIWCAAITDEALLNQVLTNPHSPERFRVQGPMSNMVEFSNEWNCPVGSVYNPENKCIVW